MTTATANIDREEIIRFAGLLMAGGNVIELRALDATVGSDRWSQTLSGYFNDADKLADAVAKIHSATGIYVTLNPCNEALLARAANRIRKPGKGSTTSDNDIARRRWMLVDADAKRPSGVSATDAELNAALERMRAVYAELKRRGFPESLAADSGNGGHLLYRVDLPRDDGGLVQRCLEAIAGQFDDAEVTIDTTVFNPARISKLYGTRACKGDDTEDRPHRMARILKLPEVLEPVPRELLKALAAEAPKAGRAQPRPYNGSPRWQSAFDLNSFVAEHLPDADGPHPWQDGGTRWTLNPSPLCDHHDGAAWLGKRGDTGAIQAGCHHNSCSWTWHDLRERFEPKAQRKAKPRETNISAAPTGYRLTDVGNAQRLVARHGADLRYVHAWGKWPVWDGRRWAVDESGEIERRAKDTARSIYREAANESDERRRADLAKHAAATERSARIAAMIELAKSEPGIPVSPADLDADPWALNTPTGTVDLRTGKLRPHRPADLLTRVTTASYVPANEAECPTWESALEKIFDGNGDLIQFVQRVLGYSLAGVTTEHVLPILYGSGSNGKSVFIDAILHALSANYACTLAPDMLLATRHEQHPTWRFDLFGRRFVAAVETDEGRRLAEGTVKLLTGGDRVKAHRMREDWMEFEPTHTLWLATNHKPIVTGTDHAIWRRLRLIAFTQRFWSADRGESGPTELEADKRLGEKLRGEADGILRWLVDGCLAWQRDGLGEPPEVRAATANYRSDMDMLGAFINQKCEVKPDATAKASELYEAYRKWAVESGERFASSRKFGSAMTERGYERYTNDGTRYRGVSLRDW